MFLNQIRDFFINNTIKKKLTDSLPDFNSNMIKKIGILIDQSTFSKSEAVVKELVDKGFDANEIVILVYKDKIYKNEIIGCASYSSKDLNWSGNFANADVNYFIDQKFDLLINYYENEKLPLLQVSNLSKARFKVGFSEIDKRINHFIISTAASNHKIFIAELFKYLKILKKI